MLSMIIGTRRDAVRYLAHIAFYFLPFTFYFLPRGQSAPARVPREKVAHGEDAMRHLG